LAGLREIAKKLKSINADMNAKLPPRELIRMMTEAFEDVDRRLVKLERALHRADPLSKTSERARG
jgi:hypothetical protein